MNWRKRKKRRVQFVLHKPKTKELPPGWYNAEITKVQQQGENIKIDLKLLEE